MHSIVTRLLRHACLSFIINLIIYLCSRLNKTQSNYNTYKHTKNEHNKLANNLTR